MLGAYRIDTVADSREELVPSLEDFLNELDHLGWQVMQVDLQEISPMGRHHYMVICRRKLDSKRWWRR